MLACSACCALACAAQSAAVHVMVSTQRALGHAHARPPWLHAVGAASMRCSAGSTARQAPLNAASVPRGSPLMLLWMPRTLLQPHYPTWHGMACWLLCWLPTSQRVAPQHNNSPVPSP